MPTTTTRTYQQPLPLLSVIPDAQRLARRHARCADEADDLVQVALFEYHRTLQRYHRQRKLVHNPRTFAIVTLERAMWAYPHDVRRAHERDHFLRLDDVRSHADQSNEVAQSVRQLPFADLRGARSAGGEQEDLFVLREYFRALEQEEGIVARVLAENLVAPRGECARRILQEAARKRARQKRQPRGSAGRVRGVQHTIRLSQEVIRRGLGLTPPQWHSTLARVRCFTVQWMRSHNGLASHCA